LGRTIDPCYETVADGDRAQGGGCEASTSNGQMPAVTFDAPRSTFSGFDRVVDTRTTRITNSLPSSTPTTDPA